MKPALTWTNFYPMIKRIFPVLALMMSLLPFSCDDKEITFDPNTSGHAYYPLELGAYRVYDVTETTYRNDIGQTEEFQIRERIDEVSTDQTGRQWYRVEISRRPIGEEVWRIQGVKMLSQSATDFRILENNQTFVHMVYPAKNGKAWVYNPLNASAGKENYSYAKVGEAFTEGPAQYENTLTIIKAETDPDNTLLFDYTFEVLALGVGPVFRSSQSYRYCDDSQEISCTGYGTNFIVTGTERKETLVDSGVIN